MKLVCIDPVVDILGFGSGIKELTYGKSYEVISFYSKSPNRTQQIRIINDLGISQDYLIDRFVSLQKWRELQIDSLLNFYI